MLLLRWQHLHPCKEACMSCCTLLLLLFVGSQRKSNALEMCDRRPILQGGGACNHN